MSGDVLPTQTGLTPEQRDAVAKALWSMIERPTVVSLERFRRLDAAKQERYREAGDVVVRLVAGMDTTP